MIGATLPIAGLRIIGTTKIPLMQPGQVVRYQQVPQLLPQLQRHQRVWQGVYAVRHSAPPCLAVHCISIQHLLACRGMVLSSLHERVSRPACEAAVDNLCACL